MNSNLPPNGSNRVPPRPAMPPQPMRPGAVNPAAAPPGGSRTDPLRPPLNPRSPREALTPQRVPAPARSRRARHPVVIVGNAVFTFLILIVVALGAAVYFGKERFDAPGPLAADKVVNIPRGLGIRDISSLLEREGVINQPLVFMGGVLVMKARGGLKYGEYQFSKHASLADVVDTIIEGRVVQHSITVAEGLTSEQIVARLLEDSDLEGQIKDIPREGTLLPETYKFTRGMTREQLLQRMQRDDRRMVEDVWEHRTPDLPLKSLEQLVTLASIVEKETGRPDERSRVASVFINRIKNRMKLQSDPTIIYGLVGGKGSLGRPIMKNEIEQKTPYNTYIIDGLPPGPIDNPGRASLEAVANPARTKDLYFVADGSGGHVFSETYDQHQKNVAKLRAHEQAVQQTADPATNAAAKP